MKINLRSIVAAGVVSLLTVGCAHPIVVSPSIAMIESGGKSHSRIQKNVGYYIDNEAIKKEVVTAGGGGDSVRYYPYRDIEEAFSKMIATVFEKSIKLKTPTDSEAISSNNLNYIIKPTLVTNSSSSGYFTWPPTNFTVDLNCEIRDVTGKLIDNSSVVGQGQAVTGEVLSDHSIAGKRAMEDALLKCSTGCWT